MLMKRGTFGEKVEEKQRGTLIADHAASVLALKLWVRFSCMESVDFSESKAS